MHSKVSRFLYEPQILKLITFECKTHNCSKERLRGYQSTGMTNNDHERKHTACAFSTKSGRMDVVYSQRFSRWTTGCPDARAN